MTDQIDFFKLRAVTHISNMVASARQKLLDELVVFASDAVILRRRMRMLEHLSLYESQILKKLQTFQTNDVVDIIDLDFVAKEINVICSRSA
jgi:hypothetical protein